MQILKLVPLMMLIMLVCACSKPSPEYEHIRDLPLDQWATYGETLPIKKRLDLQMEIIERSGHPPRMSMLDAFAADPHEGYVEIVKRLRAGDRNQYYTTILYVIDGSKGFQICEQPDRKVIQDFFRETVASKELRPDFYSC